MHLHYTCGLHNLSRLIWLFGDPLEIASLRAAAADENAQEVPSGHEAAGNGGGSERGRAGGEGAGGGDACSSDKGAAVSGHGEAAQGETARNCAHQTGLLTCVGVLSSNLQDFLDGGGVDVCLDDLLACYLTEALSGWAARARERVTEARHALRELLLGVAPNLWCVCLYLWLSVRCVYFMCV